MQKKTKRIILLIIVAVVALALLIQRKTSKISVVQEQTAKATVYINIGETQYDITNLIEQNLTPTLSAGMIPIMQNNESWEIANKNNNWYNYSNGVPAYMMLNDGTKYKSEEYYNMKKSEKVVTANDIGIQLNNDELGTIYMWVPKFAYNEDGDIIYIKQEAGVAGEYTIPDMFYYELNNQTFLLSGIWVEMNELENATKTNAKVANLNAGENDTTYGFLANTKATKMTEDSKKTIQKFINKLQKNTNSSNITNENHTILQIVDTTKTDTIKGTANYNALTEKVEIEVTYHKNDIVKILNSSGRVLAQNSLTADSGDDLIGNGKYEYIVIDNKGNMKVITAHVTGLNVYVIPDWETLKQFRDDVNANEVPTGTKVYQTADIKVNEGKYAYDEETGELTFAEDAEKWIPIGTDYYCFAGTYDGLGHTISGLYCNGNFSYTGLFGKITSKVTRISNLTLAYSTIKGKYDVGGIIGVYEGGTTDGTEYYIFENVTSERNNIIGGGVTGGLIGNCYNGAMIKHCKNSSNISSESLTGGLIGCTSSKTHIKQSYNTGNIKSTSAAGILGQNYGGSCIIEKCYNTGNIVGEISSSGFATGICFNGKIINSYNAGNITGNIRGSGITDNGTAINCCNVGNIECRYASGVAYGGTVTNCFNKGIIRGWEIGGIIADASVTASYNCGELIQTNSSYSGGIASDITSKSIEDCYNTGNMTGIANIGTMVGKLYSTGLNNCYNAGILTINGKRSYSGVSYNYGTIKNSYTLNTTYNEEYIRNLTQTLNEVKDNNGNVTETRNIWKNDTIGINSGYPILWWQTNNDELNLLNMSPNETSTYHDSEYVGAFVEDTQSINNGYPILKWQVE